MSMPESSSLENNNSVKKNHARAVSQPKKDYQIMAAQP